MRVGEKEILFHDPSEGSMGKFDAAMEGHILCAQSPGACLGYGRRPTASRLTEYVSTYVRGRRFPSSWERRRIPRCQGSYGIGGSPYVRVLVTSELLSPRISPGTGSETWPQYRTFAGYQVAPPPLSQGRAGEVDDDESVLTKISDISHRRNEGRSPGVGCVLVVRTERTLRNSLEPKRVQASDSSYWIVPIWRSGLDTRSGPSAALLQHRADLAFCSSLVGSHLVPSSASVKIF